MQGKQSHISDIDQVTKNAVLFNAIRKKPNEISEDARCKKVEKCLKEGANINAQDKNDQDNTVLHISIKNDYEKIVKFLLEKGAKINITNSENKSPLALAQELGKQNFIKILTKSINVPGDGNCLFWAVALAYLTPAKADNSLFEERYKKLFGQERLQDLPHVQTSIQNYKPFDSQQNIINDTKLNGLVTQQFRKKVVEHMRTNASNFKRSVEGESGLTFDDYLDKMNVPSEWGGEPEITAVSQILACAIKVHSASPSTYGVGTDRIELYHEGLISDTSISSVSGLNRNHYNFGVEAKIVDDYQRSVQSTDTGQQVVGDIQQLGHQLMDSNKDKGSKVQSQQQIDNIKINETYKKGGTAGIEGSLYEIKLLTLFLYKGINQGYSFRLATNMKEAEKFDDLVFKYTTDGQEESLLLQAKHRLDTSKKIEEDELLTESNTDFSLVKYFFSYQDILDKKSFRTIKEVLLYTNIDFNDATKNYVESLNNDILNFKDEPGFEKSVRYQFKKDIILNKLKPRLENYQPTRLAIKLIDIILTGEGIRKPQPGSIFEPYERILSQEVIDTKNKQFHRKFITGESLDIETKRFREIFQKVLKDKSHKFREVVKNTIKEKEEEHKKKEEQLLKEKNRSKQKQLKEEIIKLQNFIDHFQLKLIDQNSEFILEDLDKYIDNVPLTVAKNFGKIRESNNENAKWPQDTVSDDNIRDFLDHLVFAVNQPNESELGNIIECEISKDIKFKYLTSDLVADHIQRRMLEWFKEKIGKTGDKGRFLTADEGKAFLQEIEQKVNTLITMGSSIEYCVNLKDTGIKFNEQGENGLIALNDLLLQKQITHLIALEETILSAIKVYQALQYQKYDSDRFLFKKLSDLLRLDTQQSVLDAFNSSSHDLLIIECKSTTEQNVTELYNNLLAILSSDSHKDKSKKVILITRQDDALANQFAANAQNQYDKKEDRTSFNDLTPESQEKILKQEVIFQGAKVSLNKLIDENAQELIDPTTLVKLITGEEVKIGNELPISSGYDEAYYINRFFNFQVEIKKEALEAKKSSDLFAISNIDKATFSRLVPEGDEIRLFLDNDPDKINNPVKFIILSEQQAEAEKQFKHLVQDQNYEKYFIHWIKKEGDKFFEQKQYDEKEFINRQDNKIVIISDTAGMGKTTVLTDLSLKIKKQNPDLWVIRIDLNDYTEILLQERESRESHQPSFSNTDINLAIEFLLKLLECDERSKLKTNLEKELFASSFNKQGKIVLLFDGFDEINPDYKDIVINLLEALKKSQMEKLFVTTRPNVKQDLKEGLGIFLYTLKQFSEEEQMKFLIEFWQKELGLNDLNQNSKERLDQYAKTLITILSNSISDREREFTGIPLQIRMIAEVFQKTEEGKEWEGCQEFLSSNEAPKLPEKLDLIDLYDRFIKKKFYDLHWQEKKGIDFTKTGVKEAFETNYQNFVKMHKLLALYRLFSDEDLTKLLPTKEEIQEIVDWVKDIENAKENKGIIDQVIDNKPHFIHRTFAEYFVADFLANQLTKYRQNNSQIQEFLLTEILLKPDYQVIRAFFDSKLKKNQLEDDILKLYGKKINELWILDQKNLCGRNDATILHISALEGNKEVITFLINSLKKNEHVYTLTSLINAQDKNDRTVLHWAFRKHKLKIAQYLIECGADIDSKNYFGETVLHIAAFSGTLEEVQLLLKYGASVNAKNNHYQTALHLAARSGIRGIVESLMISKDQDGNSIIIDAQDKDYKTALHCAAYFNNWECVQLLAEYGADVNLQDENGRTVIYLAVKSYQWETVQLLIQYHANIYTTNNSDDMALYFAAASGEWTVVPWLVKHGANVNAKDDSGTTALHFAALSDNQEIVQLLVEYGADIDAKDRFGNTALHLAVYNNQLKVLQLLIVLGAKTTLENEDQKTALDFAKEEGDANVIKLLQQANIYVDVKDNIYGKTSLHFAAQEGWLYFIKYLIEKLPLERRVDVNIITTKNGATPLHYAADRGKLDVVKYLIEMGADINATDYSGRTPLHFAAQEGRLDIVKYLIEELPPERQVDVNIAILYELTPLHLATLRGQLDVIDYLIKKEAKVNNIGPNGETPLHFAVIKGQLNAANRLIEKGADINVIDNDGRTVLHSAAVSGQLDVVKWLVEKGADVNAKNKNNRTVLHEAAASGKLDIVKWLVEEKGADVNAIDNDRNTPSQVTVGEDIVQYLHIALVAQCLKDVIDKVDSTITANVLPSDNAVQDVPSIW